MFASLILLSAAAPAHPAAHAVIVEPPRARAQLSALFHREDYPATALRAGEQGTVGFTLAIGPDGRVHGCTITRSSGSSWLDSTTCRILRSRARYTPARDSNGNPAPGEDRGVHVWRLPAS